MAGLSLKLLASWRIEGIPWLIQRESQLSNFIGVTFHRGCIMVYVSRDFPVEFFLISDPYHREKGFLNWSSI